MPDPFHTVRTPVRWSDMDALGHVNNAVYMTYFEQARIELFQQWAEPGGEWPGAPETGPVLVAADTQFKKPVVYPATVIVRVTAGEPGRTSLPLDCELTVEGDEDAVYATARTTLVWVDRTTGRAVPLPETVRRQLADR
jgi:acyl-CoA thioester hydrolase